MAAVPPPPASAAPHTTDGASAPAPAPALTMRHEWGWMKKALQLGTLRCLATGPTATHKTRCADWLSGHTRLEGGQVHCFELACTLWRDCAARLDALHTQWAMRAQPPAQCADLVVVHGVELLSPHEVAQLSYLLLDGITARKGALNVYIECPEAALVWYPPDELLTVCDIWATFGGLGA